MSSKHNITVTNSEKNQIDLGLLLKISLNRVLTVLSRSSVKETKRTSMLQR
jgi:dUTPase